MGLKKSILGRAWVAKTPPNMEANLGSQTSIFEAQVGLHFGGVLAALGRHRLFFWSSCWTPFPDLGGREKTDFSKDLITKSIFSQPPGSGKEVQQRLPKNSLCRPRAAKTPPKMEANLGLKNRFLGAQVGLHFGGSFGGQQAPKLAPILGWILAAKSRP